MLLLGSETLVREEGGEEEGKKEEEELSLASLPSLPLSSVLLLLRDNPGWVGETNKERLLLLPVGFSMWKREFVSSYSHRHQRRNTGFVFGGIIPIRDSLLLLVVNKKRRKMNKDHRAASAFILPPPPRLLLYGMDLLPLLQCTLFFFLFLPIAASSSLLGRWWSLPPPSLSALVALSPLLRAYSLLLSLKTPSSSSPNPFLSFFSFLPFLPPLLLTSWRALSPSSSPLPPPHPQAQSSFGAWLTRLRCQKGGRGRGGREALLHRRRPHVSSTKKEMEVAGKGGGGREDWKKKGGNEQSPSFPFLPPSLLHPLVPSSPVERGGGPEMKEEGDQ